MPSFFLYYVVVNGLDIIPVGSIPTNNYKKREKKNNLIKFVKKKKSKNKSYQKFSTKLAKETKRKE